MSMVLKSNEVALSSKHNSNLYVGARYSIYESNFHLLKFLSSGADSLKILLGIFTFSSLYPFGAQSDYSSDFQIFHSIPK